MAKIKHSIVEKQALQWFKQKGWKVLPNEILETILLMSKLENIPYKPHFLIEKERQRFFINIFNKEDYFPSKKTQSWVTGFEWYKYIYSQVLADLTGIQTAVLFHNETLKEFIFRQLSELPNPIKWRVSYCLAKEYGRRDETLQCFKCWKNNPYTARNCIHRKTKSRPMAVWEVENFLDTTSFQPKLFTEGFSREKEFNKVVKISKKKFKKKTHE